MSQQALDARRSVGIVRRHKRLLGLFAALGAAAGCAYAVLFPAMLTSTTLVLLPEAVQYPAAATGSGPDSYMATQVVIAGSDQVLSAALPHVSPAVSLQKLRAEIQVTSPTSYLISVSAKGKTAAEAETTANAVAGSYISYISGPGSPIGAVPASILEPATTASGRGQPEALVVAGLLGLVAGALIGVIVSLAIGRKDKLLRERDGIANSIGVPVLASVRVDHPADAADWTRLLENTKRPYVYEWRLRKALQQLGMAEINQGNGREVGRSSILVLSLSSDRAALALGPQLAVFAASIGIPTALVIGPQQDVNVTAALRTACAIAPPASRRPSQLRVTVADDGSPDGNPDAALTVVVAVVDGQTPQVPDTARTTTTILGVSAGAATAEQLARVAVSAAVDGREVVGILVADPDPADNTTGQIPRLAQPVRRRMPTRLDGKTTEIRR